MKQCLLVMTVSFLLACSESQEQKSAACRDMITAYCFKVEECVDMLVEECMAQAIAGGACMQNLKSSVKEMRTCERDLSAATCEGGAPESCASLE